MKAWLNIKQQGSSSLKSISVWECMTQLHFEDIMVKYSRLKNSQQRNTCVHTALVAVICASIHSQAKNIKVIISPSKEKLIPITVAFCFYYLLMIVFCIHCCSLPDAAKIHIHHVQKLCSGCLCDRLGGAANRETQVRWTASGFQALGQGKR